MWFESVIPPKSNTFEDTAESECEYLAAGIGPSIG